MATREPVITSPKANMAVITWILTANGDIGRGKLLADYPDKTVIIRGTFDTTTIVIEGSANSTDGVNGTWLIMTDPQANSLSKTIDSIEAVLENPPWVRPRCSAGGAGTAITIELTAVKH